MKQEDHRAHPAGRTRPRWLLVAVLLTIAMPVLAQDHAHPHDMSEMGIQQMNRNTAQNHGEEMELAFGSGTAWQATSAPEYMWMKPWRSWDLMLHGKLFLAFNYQSGPRGAGKLEAPNWLMLMQQRKLGRGTLQFRQMISSEPLTTPHPGFPELFQAGETYHGVPLVDHQHPHDVFGELSARYVLPLGEGVNWILYGGPAAEPALGPVAYLHRDSASENPAAPLGHHQEDSTHISFGVITTGVSFSKFKLEGSVFNGREPDEERYNFDLAPMDSYSGRFWFSPNNNWAMQYSAGRLIRPEALEAGDQLRQTASINYNRPLASGNWATTLIWGRTHKTFTQTNQNSYMIESQVNYAARNYAYTRLELVDRDELFPEGGGPAGGDNFRIGAYTFGAERDLVQAHDWQLGLGGDLTFYSKPASLDPFYGQHPVGVKVFLRVRPGKMSYGHGGS